MPWLVLALLVSDWFLFTSFRKNGETGVYFALSQDGRTWEPLRNNQPVLKPEHPGMLMRDPFLTRGPDKLWHLLWTWGWNRTETGGRLRVGHATSKDLLHWSPQHSIDIFPDEPAARNAWAPEAAWDAARKEWVIFWATTIPGRFPTTEATGDNGYNHRLYAMTTRDWKTFSTPRLWFDPGFNAIDSTLVQLARDRWLMVFKDERKTPLVKKLRLAESTSPQGPFTKVSEPFTDAWVEGPSVARIGADWWIYFDHYTQPRHYGALRTRDWKTFEDMTPHLRFPDDHRHGTIVRIPAKTARLLRSQTAQ